MELFEGDEFLVSCVDHGGVGFFVECSSESCAFCFDAFLYAALFCDCQFEFHGVSPVLA